MKIGIVSDTHDNLEKAEAAAEFFEEKDCDTVIHCGDMVAPFTANLFDRDYEFHAVRGNNDGEWNLKDYIDDFGEFHGGFTKLSLDGELFAVYHGTEESIVRSLVQSGRYDYVLRGHSHAKKLDELDGTVEINPGGIAFPDQKEKFHVATLDTANGDVEFHRVDP